MSREYRVFIAELPPEGPKRMELEAGEAHHLIHVLRLTVGDTVAVFDGEGHAARARITRLGSDGVELERGASLPARESPLALSLAVAVPKGDKMSGIVRKLTELGVSEIHPLVTDRGELREPLIRKRLERWGRVALEAAKQCRRARVPRIDAPRTFDELARPGALILTPGAEPLPSVVAPGPVALIGPEGGWSENELRRARARSIDTFGLGPRTLRTETAAIAAATLLQRIAGDLGSP